MAGSRRGGGLSGPEYFYRSKTTDDFAVMVRRKRKELGLTQQQIAVRIQTEEGKAITQSYLADIETGHHPHPRPHLIDEFARALELDRYVLYLAARTVPPEVAEELSRLTPEERRAAWGAFMYAIREAEADKRKGQPGGKSVGRRGGKKD
ncbi:MAG TPA: helix-turn-helix transcriptional regulator [Capsulimonadaceae bacterium]|nr:helix-turn-helix transcriptional regulator [Capsulimonadaceae bacterium]